MSRLIFLIIICCACVNVHAQELPAPKGCGYDHYVHYLDQTFPGFKAVADQVFQHNASSLDFRDPELYTIQVVVHMVYQNESQNLPDSLIEKVIGNLSMDYRRLNADAYQVRSEFADVVGDPFIEFELAGIERQQTDATFELDILGGSLPDNVKVTAQGGSDAWDTEQYLNIWVCNIEGGGLLGYAYPPAGLSHWPQGANAPSANLDGVVIHYEVFRNTGTYTASGLLGMDEITIPVRGRTITHEVGHYLGLRHIWGDGLLSILGIPDCDADDGVNDTPQQGLSSQFQCDVNQNTCQDGSNDLPDMFENFMDYAAEDCMNSFTSEQIAIMRSVLENERSGLISNVTSSETDLPLANAFQVYPNPARGQLFITSSQHSTEAFEVRLIDQQGRLIKILNLADYNNNQVLNINDVQPGLYGLLITNGKEQTFKRVVIQ